MRGSLSAWSLLLAALIVPGSAFTQGGYSDPWGLPSGSATLKLATQAAIAAGAAVQGFDFATGSVDSTHSYMELIQAGTVDLVFFELHPDSSRAYFRAPEDANLFDRYLIASLADSVDLAGITHMQGVWLDRFAPVQEGWAYVMLQEQAGSEPAESAVKLEVSALADSSVSFDWVWQPNGSLVFVPSSTETRSLSALKALFGL